MSLHQKVYGSLRWKRSDTYCASKLGILLEEYKKLKKEVLLSPPSPTVATNKITEWKENLEAGTAEIKAFAVCEPRTAEEIIELLKIDTTKWKLSSYWNKETYSGWMISAMVTAVKIEQKDILVELIANLNPTCQFETGPTYINDKFDRDCVGIISTQDLHFGKEGNDDIVENFKDAIRTLSYRAYASHKLEKIIYVIGGDLLNMDTFNGTTTSGTPVDNDMKATEAYQKAFDALDKNSHRGTAFRPREFF